MPEAPPPHSIILIYRQPLNSIAYRLQTGDKRVVRFDRGLDRNVIGQSKADGLKQPAPLSCIEFAVLKSCGLCCCSTPILRILALPRTAATAAAWALSARASYWISLSSRAIFSAVSAALRAAMAWSSRTRSRIGLTRFNRREAAHSAEPPRFPWSFAV